MFGKSMSLADWSLIVTIVSVLSTATIGAIATYIARQQSRTHRENLRLALYDRRMAVYRALQDLLLAVVTEADLKLEPLSKFAINTADSTFLFGSDITNYLAEVRSVATQLRATNAKLSHNAGYPAGADRSKVVEDNHDALTWISEQVEEAPRRFAKYLSFSDLYGKL